MDTLHTHDRIAALLMRIAVLEAENARLHSLTEALKASHAELQQAFDHAATYVPSRVVLPVSGSTH